MSSYQVRRTRILTTRPHDAAISRLLCRCSRSRARNHTNSHATAYALALTTRAPDFSQTPDSKKEEFRKYLEKSGVIDALTKGADRFSLFCSRAFRPSRGARDSRRFLRGVES